MKLAILVHAMAVAVSIAGCSDSQDGPAAILSATKDIDQGNPSAAIIKLKSIASSGNESPEVRYLLGRALYDLGDYVAAEIELRKARSAKHSSDHADQVAAALARTLVELRKDRELLSELDGVHLQSSSASADVSTSLAIATARTVGAEEGLRRIDDVLKGNPDLSRAIVTKARLLGGLRRTEEALKLLADLLAKNSSDSDALWAQADIKLYGKSDTSGAKSDYLKLLERKPRNLAARSSLLAILVHDNAKDELRSQLSNLKGLAPNSPQTSFFEAQLLIMEENYRGARDKLAGLVSVVGNDAQVLQLAGAVELKLDNLTQAEKYLVRALSTPPGSSTARRMLAQIYQRTGQYEKAFSVLQPELNKGSSDLEALTLAAEAQLARGAIVEAESLLKRALAASPADAKVQTSYALVRFARGDRDRAFAALEAAAKSDRGAIADLALISAKLKIGDLGGALAAADSLIIKQPKSAHPRFLRGQILANKGATADAAKEFATALELDRSYFPAVAALSAFDARQGKFDAAIGRLDGYLTNNPGNLRALLLLAELKANLKSPKDDVLKILETAITANSEEALPRIAKVNYLMLQRDYKGALAVATETNARFADSIDVAAALARAQVAAGEQNQATATLGRILAKDPKLMWAQLKLAELQVSRQEFAQARATLRRALELQPDNLDAQLATIALSVKTKDFDAARQIAKQVQKQRPDSVIGYSFEGDIEAAAGNTDAAVKAFLTGTKFIGASKLPLKIHNLLLSKKRLDEAKRFASDWRKDHPKDVDFLLHLGDIAMGKKDWLEAEEIFSQVATIQPKNSAALNNLAWSMSAQDKPEALSAIDQALKISPDNPAYLDTKATILLRSGKVADGIELARQAVAASSENAMYQFNLARALLKGGRSAEAKGILDSMIKSEHRGISRAEIDKLLATLK